MSKLPSISGDFVRVVEAMRAAQKTYFKDRTKSAMQESIRLERIVDGMIFGYNERIGQAVSMVGQMSLTDTPGAYNVEHEQTKE